MFQENQIMSHPDLSSTSKHHAQTGLSDWFAWRTTRVLRFLADTFCAGRYGHRAVVLETVAAVPGMVGGALRHLRSLRTMKEDAGWIQTLLDEAENERMHLMTFIHIAKPNLLERWLIILVQGIFYNLFSFFIWCRRAPLTDWSAILKKKPFSATPNTSKALTVATMTTCRPRKLLSTTGSCHPMRACVM
jgi:ubiquinol oxidase